MATFASAIGFRSGDHGIGSIRRHRYVFRNARTTKENSERSPMKKGSVSLSSGGLRRHEPVPAIEWNAVARGGALDNPSPALGAGKTACVQPVAAEAATTKCAGSARFL